MARSDDIVAYQYRAALYCSRDILGAMPFGPGGDFDGWALAVGADPMTTEENLSEIAMAFGIERFDERSFDSGDFPKVVFRDQITDDDHCDVCGCPLEDE